ncbi:MAG: hypothetical protein JW943_16420 [Deltaproteobacteria bacterium]|nr:hypothetical protein [Deltaproteobacteria bacterium]
MMKAGKLLIVFFAVLGLMVGATMIKAPAASAADLTGTWLVQAQTPSGSGTPTFVLKQVGNNIAGTYKGVFGESDVLGTATGNDFKLDYESSGTRIIYKGKLDGDKISGTISLGQYGDGTFTGKRQ